MSKRAHHSEGEDEANPIAKEAAKAEKQSKKPAQRTMSFRAQPKKEKNDNQPKTPKTRTFSLRSPERAQLKLSETISDCKKHLKNNGNYEFISCYTLKSKKTFILTPTHFFLAKKGFKPENKDSYIFPWYYMTSFKVSKDQVDLQFKSLNEAPSPEEKLDFKLKFDKNEYDEGVGRICNVLQNVLVPRELRVLKFYDLGAPRVQISALSAIYRFRMLNSIAKLNSKTSKEIEDIIIYSQPEIDVSRFPEEANKILPVLYKLLPFLYNVQTIKIPPNDLPITESFRPIRDSTSLLALKISGEYGENLQEFIKNISETEDRGTQLGGVIFNKSNFGAEELETISGFISKTKVRSIGFNNAIKQESVPDFYSNFLQPKVTDYLLSLNLDGTLNLDVEKIFPRLRKVALLSLANCDLNLFQVFKQLSKFSSNLSQLQMINLSNNIVQADDITEFPSTESKLPSRLTGFVLDGITWGDNLKNFLEFIFNHVESKLKLTLSNSQAEGQEWEETFKFLNESEYSAFSELVWDNNPVNESLFTFLEKNKDLIRLQLNGCLTDSKEDEINAFCNFLKSASSLEGLIVRGESNEYSLGKFTPRVIEAAKEAKELVFLDLGDTKAGEVIEDTNTVDEANTCVSDSLQQLLQLCKDSAKLEYLNYDGMMPNTADPYVFMLNEMKGSSERIKISFPIRDLERLTSGEQIKSRQFRKLRDEFAFLQGFEFPEKQYQKSKNAKKTSSLDIYPWTDSIFSKPSSLYRLYDPPIFPYYVSVKVQDKLKSSSQPFSLAVEQDDLRWDPEAQQPLRSLTQEKFDLHSDEGTKPKSRSQKNRPRFGSVRIPHKSTMTFKKGINGSKSLVPQIEQESKKKQEDIKRREKKAKEEQEEKERLEKEEQERIEREEQERKEKEEQERLEKEEQERKEREEQERLEKEEQERREREEQERLEKEEQERKEREEQERIEKEEQERREREEQERIEREEQERKEREEQERLEKEEQERKEREEQERLEKEEQERKEKEEQERIEREEQERIEREEQERKEREEQERKEREEAQIDKKLGIKKRSIQIENPDSYSLSADVSGSNDEDEQIQEQTKRQKLMPSSSGSLKPPIPLRKSSTASSELLLEPDYSLNAKSFDDISYPINWEKIDEQITLDSLYEKLSKEKRSDLMVRLKQEKPRRK